VAQAKYDHHRGRYGTALDHMCQVARSRKPLSIEEKLVFSESLYATLGPFETLYDGMVYHEPHKPARSACSASARHFLSTFSGKVRSEIGENLISTGNRVREAIETFLMETVTDSSTCALYNGFLGYVYSVMSKAVPEHEKFRYRNKARSAYLTAIDQSRDLDTIVPHISFSKSLEALNQWAAADLEAEAAYDGTMSAKSNQPRTVLSPITGSPANVASPDHVIPPPVQMNAEPSQPVTTADIIAPKPTTPVYSPSSSLADILADVQFNLPSLDY
jgi:hypothetical protein